MSGHIVFFTIFIVVWFTNYLSVLFSLFSLMLLDQIIANNDTLIGPYMVTLKESQIQLCMRKMNTNKGQNKQMKNFIFCLLESSPSSFRVPSLLSWPRPSPSLLAYHYYDVQTAGQWKETGRWSNSSHIISTFLTDVIT